MDLCAAHSAAQINLRHEVGLPRPRSRRPVSTAAVAPPPPKPISPEHAALVKRVSDAIVAKVGTRQYEAQIADVEGTASERVWKIYLRWDPTRAPLEAWLWSHMKLVALDIVRDITGHRRVYTVTITPASDFIYGDDYGDDYGNEYWGMN